MRVILSGGGTAGHINPAIAIANCIKDEEPNAEILFVGALRGMEKELVPKAGYPIRFIEVQGLKHKLSLENIKILLKTIMSVRQAKKIIKEFKPDVVIGTGGYVSGPALYAASKMKIPTLIHEQNAFPGVTTKMLKKRVDIVAISFAESRKYFEGAKRIELTGNPLRSELFKQSKENARKQLRIDERPLMVVMGGSLGAQNLNEAVIDYICGNPDKLQVIMSTGERDYDRVMKQINERGFKLEKYPNIKIEKYIYNSEIVYPAADFLVLRGGAISICEACALGKPAVIIPSPNVANNHQEYNARAMERAGGAIVVLDSELSGGGLSKALDRITADKHTLERMGASAAKTGILDSAEQLKRLTMELT